MGGRDSSKRRLEMSERLEWIQQVSEDRLDRYERMLASSGNTVRRDGKTPRTDDTRQYFSSLIRGERQRRDLGE